MHQKCAFALFFVLTCPFFGIPLAAATSDAVDGTGHSAYPANVDPGSYRIGPQDLLAVEVFRINELARTVRVDSAGNISLPLIGTVKAAGLTASELESIVAVRLGQSYLQDPYVSIFIKEYTNQRVTVDGAVKKPGIYALKGHTTLLQTIAMAEGFSDLADIERIQVFREKQGGARERHDYNVKAIRSGEVADPRVANDDLIIVRKATSRSFIKSVTDTLRGFIGFGRFPY